MAKPVDTLNVNGRLYKQISDLLHQLESDPNITVRERIAALVAVGRVQTIFVGLRKENKDDPDAGSAVRKYASAFSKNATGRGKKTARAAAASDDFDAGDWDDDDDGDAA